MLENVEPVDLVALTEDVVSLLEPRLLHAGVKVKINAAQPLPKLRGEHFFLRQALINLLENAIDFSPQHGVVSITLSQDANGSITLAVTDQGPDIPDYALAKVFERFYSLPRPGGKDKSTGLGLCFVQQVALLHRGKVQLRNRSEGGAEALLTFGSAI